jgi:hypothetical protein
VEKAAKGYMKLSYLVWDTSLFQLLKEYLRVCALPLVLRTQLLERIINVLPRDIAFVFALNNLNQRGRLDTSAAILGKGKGMWVWVWVCVCACACVQPKIFTQLILQIKT